MRWMFRAGACATLICFTSATMAEARGCATPAEYAAVQVSAVQQELTDAALACGPQETRLFNRFQTVFNKELRRSDARMLAMFKRLYGPARGSAAYDSYKTRAIAHAELRRTQPGAAEGFCKTADIMFATALAPDKPALEDFVAGVQAEQEHPVTACPVKLARRAGAAEDVVPIARPALTGDPPAPGKFGE